IYSILNYQEPTLKIVTISVILMVFINFSFNSYFYPTLLMYQGGSSIALIIKEKNIDVENVYIHNGKYSWPLNFYTRRITPSINTENIHKLNKDEIWVYINKEESLKE